MAAALATESSSNVQEMLDIEQNKSNERAQWVLNAPKPPGFWQELVNSVRETFFPHRRKFKNEHDGFNLVFTFLHGLFPILHWCRNYKASKFRNDLMAGLTLASLCIPQSIGYATLAKLDPQYGLYTSVVPPLIYAVMGTSREIAIGPVAVVSLLLSSMIQKVQDPLANPIAYRNFVLTATFFAGIFQASFGLFRLGFLIDILSHAAVVGFMAGAAMVIGLQQLKGLLGIPHFTNKTDAISVVKANFILGCSFLCFILTTRYLGRKKRKLFWLPAIAPLVSVILSTLFVFLTRADKHGVKIVKHIDRGLNPSSVHQIQFHGQHVGEVAKIGFVAAIVALAEAIAVGRSFASIKGYRLDGNKEMVAMGFMNIVGSFTSCYVATGSFSRSAVNFRAGCESTVSNIVMAITVLISLEFFTRLLYYTPMAILASIIMSALPGLIDFNEFYNIWKVDKLDFLACIGAFFGVLFASVEIGLLVAVTISFAKIILISIQPGTEKLGKLPGTDLFCDVDQYPMAVKTPGILIIRVKSALLCFANANSVRERIMRWITEEEEEEEKESSQRKARKNTQLVLLDLSSKFNFCINITVSLINFKRVETF
ncbi:Sulfate transporter 2.1 [Citrus sinensis]|uniref:Sulfate transporter 2.1 n=1 Tax=Citrus sinensis TaxID=2711 RepID=A0ACB8JLJ5_CITSI|nr:Sulfate transporter 2.1 [Citrus sinensis]